MCTAITFQTNNFYFGRNLDLERNYGESVVITPRNYSFHFRNGKIISNHYALIGMAVVAKGYPLYFEATNEKGLSMAGLNFPGNAKYNKAASELDNVSPFEFIPWILCQCKSMEEVMNLIKRINLWEEPFSESFPISPLHWLIADRNNSITVEATEKGLQIYENLVGVLTNNPSFDYHMQNLANYLHVSSAYPKNSFSDKLDLHPYSLGMGALGLPGDPSSASRFVKAAFVKFNSASSDSETESVIQFFHILSSVAQQKGITQLPNKELEYTMYSSCCNTDKGIYYYTTYSNSRISAANMYRENLDNSQLIVFPQKTETDILNLN